MSKTRSVGRERFALKVGVLEPEMSRVGKTTEVRRSREVVSRVVADEAIVVPIRRGAADMDSIFTFNEAGTKLWAMIEANRSASELAAHLEAEYGLSAEKAAADTEQFLADLISAGLVEAG
jgi:Coenzyme PQQ synthesis protein D (PqqD)